MKAKQKEETMTEKEMLDCLLAVWKNMSRVKDMEAYEEMLILLDEISYYLRHDLQCDYMPPRLEVREGEFSF